VLPGQQAFGDALLDAHTFALIPSAVGRWHLALRTHEAFVLDPRLHPPRA